MFPRIPMATLGTFTGHLNHSTKFNFSSKKFNMSTASSTPNNSSEDDFVHLSANIQESQNISYQQRVDKPPGSRSRWSQASLFEKIVWLVKIPFRMVFCLSNVTVFFITYIGFMVPVLPLKKIWPRFFYYYEGTLYQMLQAFIAYWGYTADYDVYEYGDDIHQLAEEERVLLICNHQSTADVPTLFTVLQDKGVAARKTIWLMDVMFRWTPFGIVARMHGDYFIRQGKSTRDKELVQLKNHLHKVFWNRDRRWVILFPEGGFYYKRVETSQNFNFFSFWYARENGYPHLEYCTLPRMGAMKAILDAVGPRYNEDGTEEVIHRSPSGNALKLIKNTVEDIREKKYIKETRPPIRYVLDVTIAYPNGKPLSINTLVFGTREECEISVYNAAEVPFQDENALRDWLYQRYVEKDQILAHYYQTGEFNRGGPGHRVVWPSWTLMFAQYGIWFGAFAIQLKFYSWLGLVLTRFILGL